MMKNKIIKLMVTGLIVLFTVIALASCSQGVSVEEAQQMQEEVKAISNRMSQIESTLLELKEEEVDASSTGSPNCF